MHGDGVDLTESSSWLGTPYYMSPEQAENPRSVDVRADIYSFGATFYHALTGRPPFEGASAFSVLFKHKTQPLTAPRAINEAISTATNDLLERCLAKSPDQRFSCFAEILNCLSPRSTTRSAWEPVDETDIQPYLDQYMQKRSGYLERAMQLGERDEYLFAGGRRLQIAVGDITSEIADAIISPDNSEITMNDGCSLAIRNAADEGIHEFAQQFAPVLVGRIIVTPAGKLNAKFIFHAITNGYGPRMARPSRDIVSELISAVFYQADGLSIRTIALPLLGTGGAGLASDVALDAMFLALARQLHRGVSTVEQVRLVLYPKTISNPKSGQ
jgi:O-acetyl-ADP-ribose deacetylase (regulator of RNase III)